MKKLVLVVIVAMLAALVGAPPAAVARPGEDAKGNTYRTYTACSARLDAVPARRCPKRGTKGAFFKSVDAHVHYKVCVKFPNGQKLCARNQDAPRGRLQVNAITSDRIGEHTVTWFVGGNKVSTRRFTIHG